MTGSPAIDPATLDALNAWFRSTKPRAASFVRAWLISGGHSNLTFGLVDEEGSQFCLRRPPLGQVPAAAHNVGREYQILERLQATNVQVPRTVAACASPAVVGAPFYVMTFVNGQICASSADSGSLGMSARRQVGPAMVEALVRIHQVDLEAIGLSGLTRAGTYVNRQLRRWLGQLSASDRARHSLLEAVADKLRRLEPVPESHGLIHGDFKMGNCVLDEFGSIEAVLDWELASVGDPIADLGWLVASWSGQGETTPRIVTPPTRREGFQQSEDLVERYMTLTDRDASSIAYYVALAHWRWACIDVGIHHRFSAGSMLGQHIDPDVVDAEIDDRLETAYDLLDTSRGGS